MLKKMLLGSLVGLGLLVTLAVPGIAEGRAATADPQFAMNWSHSRTTTFSIGWTAKSDPMVQWFFEGK